VPNELQDAMPFDEDEAHCAYDRVYANRYWRILVQADRGVHRLSRPLRRQVQRRAPVLGCARPRGDAILGTIGPGSTPEAFQTFPDWVTREAYSHEVSSCGFWPGGGSIAYPAFYAYAYPAPPGFAAATVKPAEAFYSSEYGEFILPYDAVRQSPSPDSDTARISADDVRSRRDLGKWNREMLERRNDPRA
jgi:hypothetical protein